MCSTTTMKQHYIIIFLFLFLFCAPILSVAQFGLPAGFELKKFQENENESFYFDYQGNKMPLSENFTARVPLVSGEINDENSKDLNELFRFIYDDDFLKKNMLETTCV